MSLINTKIKPFHNTAFKNGEFIDVTEKDTEGKWSVFFFYQLTLPLFAQPN